MKEVWIMKKLNVTLLGTGLMGVRMAQNICKGGARTRVWNRTLSKAEPLAAHGAKICKTAAEAVLNADIIISMLSDGSISRFVQTNKAVRASLKSGAVWIEMASIKPEEARVSAQDLLLLGVRYIDAPVSGGTRGAETASLSIMAGGEASDFDYVAPILRTMGKPVHVGPVGSGQLAKLANQAIVGVTIAAVAEAMLLLQKGGADPKAVRLALAGGFADSTVLQLHGARMTDGDFAPGGPSHLQLKDLNNVLAEAKQFGIKLPAVASTRDRFERLITELNGASLDHSALYLELIDKNNSENV